MHGCLKSLESLVDQLPLSPDEDQVFLLGDYVNKGPDSIGVLRYLIEWAEQPNVYPLLGNHDAILINALRCNEFPEGFEEFSSLDESDKAAFLTFLESLPYYFILDDFILVHAGMNFTLANPFLGKEEMLNIRDFYYDSAKAQNKSIVHGHNPFPFSEIQGAVHNRSKILPLDNGCVYAGMREHMGKLICLELDDMELFWQEHCE